MKTLEKQKIRVLGLGVTGRSSVNFCAAQGAKVTAADERAPEQMQNLDSLSP